jgi:CxxC motif-containing protein
MSKKRELTCIVCPRGCGLTVELSDGGDVLEIYGNLCKRGKVYAQAECTDPQRTVTSTVRCKDGEVVSVKTSGTVSKALMFDVMKRINTVVAPETVKIGDVIIENVCDCGVDVIATSNKN